MLQSYKQRVRTAYTTERTQTRLRARPNLSYCRQKRFVKFVAFLARAMPDMGSAVAERATLNFVATFKCSERNNQADREPQIQQNSNYSKSLPICVLTRTKSQPCIVLSSTPCFLLKMLTTSVRNPTKEPPPLLSSLLSSTTVFAKTNVQDRM